MDVNTNYSEARKLAIEGKLAELLQVDFSNLTSLRTFKVIKGLNLGTEHMFPESNPLFMLWLKILARPSEYLDCVEYLNVLIGDALRFSIAAMELARTVESLIACEPGSTDMSDYLNDISFWFGQLNFHTQEWFGEGDVEFTDYLATFRELLTPLSTP